MSVHVLVGPGMRLVASVVFKVPGPLFVTILGPAGVTFGAGWPSSGPKVIENTSGDVWQFSVQASHHGPMGSEVPVSVVSKTGSVTCIAVGRPTSAEAWLSVVVTPIS